MVESTALVPTTPKLPKTLKVAGIRKSTALSSTGTVGFITRQEVEAIIDALWEMSSSGHQERNTLFVKTTFDACLRCSEALSLRPMDLVISEDGVVIRLIGKGNKPGESALSASVANELMTYAFNTNLLKHKRFFPFSRRRAHQMVQGAMRAAGIRKPDGVGTVHVLRHAGALERLKITGNPRALQHQLRHASGDMTMRYMKTLEKQQSMEIMKGVDLW